MTQFSALTAEIRTLVSLWSSTTLHFAHVAERVAERVAEPKMSNAGLNAIGERITLEEIMVQIKYIADKNTRYNQC